MQERDTEGHRGLVQRVRAAQCALLSKPAVQRRVEAAVPADAPVIINIVELAGLHTAHQREHQPLREGDPLQTFHNWRALVPPSGLPAVSPI